MNALVLIHLLQNIHHRVVIGWPAQLHLKNGKANRFLFQTWHPECQPMYQCICPTHKYPWFQSGDLHWSSLVVVLHLKLNRNMNVLHKRYQFDYRASEFGSFPCSCEVVRCQCKSSVHCPGWITLTVDSEMLQWRIEEKLFKNYSI